MSRYVPRRTRRRRRVLASALAWFLAACAVAGFTIARRPSLVPGGPEFFDQLAVFRDLLRLPRTLKTSVRGAEFWGRGLLVLDVEFRNDSRFVILCQDLRLVDRSGRVYLPSSTSVYYVNRDESLWMRQINPGSAVAGGFAFVVPDGAFGLACAVETRIGLVRLAPVKEIARRRR